jgi:hypothetical protein
MPSINQSKKIVASQWGKHPEVVPMFWGKPGMGKSHAALQLGEELGIPKDRTLVVHINNHDVVDFTGVPSVVDGQTIFNPTDMFYKFREGTGAGLIVLEELAQSSHHHQQWAGGFTEERATATFKLDPEVRIIASGNRAEDRAGAKPLLSHLNDRLWHLDIETSLDDWCEWAMDNGVPAIGVAFLRLRPDLLNDFDPSRRSNPTQRSWTKLLTQLPDDLPRDLYLMAAEGKVGEGAAAEWVAARDMMHKMPSVDAIRLKPEAMEIPDEPSVKYAVATSMSMSTTPDLFSSDMKYISRMPKEFQMVYVTDALRLHVDLAQTRDFIDWAIKNKDIFVGGN